MARGITEFRITLDPALQERDRLILGDLIVNAIKNRTAEGKDIDGNNFKSYDRDYLENLRDDGIEKQTPNLQITGDMLNGLEIIDQGTGFLVIGIGRDNRLALLKAGWQQGGNPKIPSRPFMGFPDAKITELQDFILTATPETAGDTLLALQIRQQFELTDIVLENLNFIDPSDLREDRREEARRLIASGTLVEGFEGIEGN